MIQTLALLNAAYRELNARKLFWVTMVISLLIVAVFAALGINEKGITVLWRYSQHWPHKPKSPNHAHWRHSHLHARWRYSQHWDV